MPANTALEFDFRELLSFPRLAWALTWERGAGIAKVFHGPWVETNKAFFVEGAWDGGFSAAQFDSSFMTGTGGKIEGDRLLLATPSHTLDRLNVIEKSGVLYVSNSLPCLLAAADEALDRTFLFYDSYVASIKYGLGAYEKRIPTLSGRALEFYYCCNLVVSRDHEIRSTPKVASPRFRSYAAYRDVVYTVVRQIGLNSMDRSRKVNYKPLATVSRGYDSPTAMILSMLADCKEAITFKGSRGTVADEDCGTRLAEMVGLSVKEFGRLDYCRRGDFPEVLNSGGPSEFLSFGDALSGRLLFTGFHGDKIWDKNCDKISTDFIRGDASGVSLTELRLQEGFCHLPVAFIGGDRHPDIVRISNDDDMAAWSLHNTYDRPICRRIVEGAGIPRAMFGQQKRAAGVLVSSEGLAATMSEHSLKEFEQYLAEDWTVRMSTKSILFGIVKRAASLIDSVARAGARASLLLGLSRKVLRPPDVIPHKLAMLANGYLGKEALLFHWGHEKLTASYKSALST